MTFLLRRVAYAAIIIFMFNRPFFGTMLLIAVSMFALSWVLSESQWEHGLINQQHIVNEIVLYVCLILLVLCSDMVYTQDARDVIGWTFIALICFMVLYNGLIIAYFSCKHLKLVALRCQRRAFAKNQSLSGRSSSAKVAPMLMPEPSDD